MVDGRIVPALDPRRFVVRSAERKFLWPARVVALSTIGGHVERPNLRNQFNMLEAAMRHLHCPSRSCGPRGFMKNSTWDIAPAREAGVVPSFLQPLDKPVLMMSKLSHRIE